MAKYQFLNFCFDTESYHLHLNKRRHDIRPKTALLLGYLLTNRDRVLAKKELFEAVWQSEHVQDHTLFQLISEIRKLAPSEELIRTQPNIGYRWVIKTVPAQSGQLFSKYSMAAGVVAASLMTAAVSFSFNISTPGQKLSESHLTSDGSRLLSDTTPSNAAIFPALSAYSKGLVALDKGAHQEAEQWLRFSLAENPDSAEAQLLLAESLYQQDEYEASEHYARQVLEQPKPSSYISSAASDLLSRLYQKQGSLFDALNYAVNGTALLDASQSQCTYEVLDQRIDTLKQLIEQQSNEQQSNEQLASEAFNEESTANRLAKNSDKNKTRTAASKTQHPSVQNNNGQKAEGSVSEDCIKYQSSEKGDDLSACNISSDFELWANNQFNIRRYFIA